MSKDKDLRTRIGAKDRRGFDVLAWVEALEDADRQASAKLEPAGQGDDQAAA
jgi:hypothetical protein